MTVIDRAAPTQSEHVSIRWRSALKSPSLSNPLDSGLVRDDNGVTWRFLPAVVPNWNEVLRPAMGRRRHEMRTSELDPNLGDGRGAACIKIVPAHSGTDNDPLQ